MSNRVSRTIPVKIDDDSNIIRSSDPVLGSVKTESLQGMRVKNYYKYKETDVYKEDEDFSIHNRVIGTSNIDENFKSIQEDKLALKIIKAHFIEPMLESLNCLINNYNEYPSAIYIEQIFDCLRGLDDIIPYDPHMELLRSFYDALRVNNYWKDYTKEQYKQAYEVLNKVYNEKNNLKEKVIDEAINKIENIGFDTTPYEIESEY